MTHQFERLALWLGIPSDPNILQSYRGKPGREWDLSAVSEQAKVKPGYTSTVTESLSPSRAKKILINILSPWGLQSPLTHTKESVLLGTNGALTPQNTAAEPKRTKRSSVPQPGCGRRRLAPRAHLQRLDQPRGPPKVWDPLPGSLEPEPPSLSMGAGRAGLAWGGFGFC